MCALTPRRIVHQMNELPGPLNRWGRLIAPNDEAGAFVLIEKEKPEGWKTRPPDDAYRIYHRRPGTRGDDDINNWTVWFHLDQVSDWWAGMGFRVDDWLPEGTDPT